MSKVLIVPLEDFLGTFGISGNQEYAKDYIEINELISSSIEEYKQEGWSIIAFAETSRREDKKDRKLDVDSPYIRILEEFTFLDTIAFYYYRDNISIWIDRQDLMKTGDTLSNSEFMAENKTELSYPYYSFGYSLVHHCVRFLSEDRVHNRSAIAFICSHIKQIKFCKARGIYTIDKDLFKKWLEPNSHINHYECIQYNLEEFFPEKRYPFEPTLF